MRDVELGGIHYQIGKLDAFKQFHVARRLAPILATVASAAANIPESERPTPETDEAAAERWFGKMAAPLVEAFSSMNDETADYILLTCLTAVGRDAGKGTWAPVLSRQRTLMYQDIDMGTMVQLTVAVIQENLAGFFSSLQAGSLGAATKAASSS